MSIYAMIITIVFVFAVIGMVIYWSIKDRSIVLRQKIDFLERQNKIQSAILLENTGLKILRNPTLTSLKQAGITPDDLHYFGYSEEEIKRIFTNT